ncbi:MAG: type II toxin-antitoxin system RelE/ParE family toxin [Eubacteriales bacterium]
MIEFEMIFYEKNNGEQPIKDFLCSLDMKMRAKMFRCMDILKKNGNELREPYTKPLGNGIFELRAKQGSDISRVLYFFVIGKKIILTNGYIKQTNKTPSSELELAEKYRKDYLKRFRKEI